nr:MAG TPA: hypothetical protein [Caudoviricetes sp.]
MRWRISFFVRWERPSISIIFVGFVGVGLNIPPIFSNLKT